MDGIDACFKIAKVGFGDATERNLREHYCQYHDEVVILNTLINAVRALRSERNCLSQRTTTLTKQIENLRQQKLF